MLLQQSLALVLVPLVVLFGAVLGAIAYSDPVTMEIQVVTRSISNLVSGVKR